MPLKGNLPVTIKTEEKQITKVHIQNRFLRPVLAAGLGLVLAGRLPAQTFTTLHSFTAPAGPPGTNSDGASPQAGLILSGGTLYGTAHNGGTNGGGAVFRVNTDGTAFTNLHSFTATAGPVPGTNSDGANSWAVLILSGTNLFGTAQNGGTNGRGTVFRVNTDGTVFKNLHNFPALAGHPPTNSEGASPIAGLVLSGNTLYGTAAYGGTNGSGTVFALNTDGTGFTNLYTFTARAGSLFTNSDGASPQSVLLLAGASPYGTTYLGGTNGTGTVFVLNTNGTGFTTLHNFAVASGSLATNTEGANPWAGLILSGNTLYGTATDGGTNGSGTVFRVNTDGTAFTNLHSFMVLPAPDSTNGDGALPIAPLILSGSTLYGTAYQGGTGGSGTVFALNTDGTDFTNLYFFTAQYPVHGTNHDGIWPDGGLVLSGKTLYGTAQGGGDSLWGTVFSLALESQLNILLSGTNVILTWPANAAGSTLQSATNLASQSVWSTNLPAPVVVNGQNTVTNPISGAQMFYRLSQ
jgi:uncharacterized repeat protein (TIGR03803 family)